MNPSICAYLARLRRKVRYFQNRSLTYATLLKVTVLFLLSTLYILQNSVKTTTKDTTLAWSNTAIKKALHQKEPTKAVTLKPCEDGGLSVTLLIMVNSECTNFKHRAAIRESWGSVSVNDKSVRVIFVLGIPRDQAVQESINLEQVIYNDILIANVTEAYDKLTYKSIAILKWAHTFCSKVKYLIKVDDDIFFNVRRLLLDLENNKPVNSIIGCEESKNAPVRFFLFKWHVTREQYSADTYPVYITGPAYLITGDIISKLYRATFDVPYFFIEDIFITGLAREKIGAREIGHKEFSCSYRDRSPCGVSFRDYMVGHHYYPDEMVRMWSELNDPNAKCRFRDNYLIATILDFFHG